MPCVALGIHRISHPPAARISYSLSTARIVAHVSLRGPSGWSRYRPGIADTGAAVSPFPAQAWRDAEANAIGPILIGGIVPRDECRVPARLATPSRVLSDGTNIIGPLDIHACLAESDEGPLLLGIGDLLEAGVLTMAIRQNLATFEQ